MYHIKIVNFFDGFAFKNREEPVSINAFEIMNLPAFVHFPAFNFLQAILNALKGQKLALTFSKCWMTLFNILQPS